MNTWCLLTLYEFVSLLFVSQSIHEALHSLIYYHSDLTVTSVPAESVVTTNFSTDSSQLLSGLYKFWHYEIVARNFPAGDWQQTDNLLVVWLLLICRERERRLLSLLTCPRHRISWEPDLHNSDHQRNFSGYKLRPASNLKLFHNSIIS